jgi:hypothetical protein
LLLLGGALPRKSQASGRAALQAPTSAVSWQHLVTLPDASRGILEITTTVRGLSGDVRMCLFMDGAEPHLRAIRRITPGPAITEDDGCFMLRAAQPQGTTFAYTYDLRALADRTGQPDFAERIGDTYLWNDQAVLLHPSPLPEPATIEVELRLPAGMPLVTPWTRLPGPGQRFTMNSQQHDGGSYIGMGSLLSSLGTLPLPGNKTVGKLYLVNLPHKATDDALRAWIGQALGAVASFYGDLLSREVLITLVPISGSPDPGVFGTVVRRGTPSAVIYFGADCVNPIVGQDWLAVHELFHIGNPIVARKIPWFVEGFTTYYQDVLRARARSLNAVDAWSDLYDGFRRFCLPEGKRSLDEESRSLYASHRYTRVYWGGACVAFLADAAIRTRSRGKHNLDDVLLRLRKKSLDAPIDEDTVVAALDAEAGDKLVSRLLKENRPAAFSAELSGWLRRLGIEPTSPKTVRLIDAAPLSTVRDGILAAKPTVQ